MQEGTVKFFNNLKGLGFIKSSETGEDIFVHNSGLRDDIREERGRDEKRNDEIQLYR